jgi:hypothetical protein
LQESSHALVQDKRAPADFHRLELPFGDKAIDGGPAYADYPAYLTDIERKQLGGCNVIHGHSFPPRFVAANAQIFAGVR